MQKTFDINTTGHRVAGLWFSHDVAREIELHKNPDYDDPYFMKVVFRYTLYGIGVLTHIHHYKLTLDEYIYLRRKLRKPVRVYRRPTRLNETYYRGEIRHEVGFYHYG